MIFFNVYKQHLILMCEKLNTNRLKNRLKLSGVLKNGAFPYSWRSNKKVPIFGRRAATRCFTLT
jgi:hypothetical protein